MVLAFGVIPIAGFMVTEICAMVIIVDFVFVVVVDWTVVPVSAMFGSWTLWDRGN